jgi:hypothetical protein
MEVTLKTPRNVYTISSDRALTDSKSSFGDGLFGGISWPVSRFRITERLLLEQQMFLPHDESTVAMSWALRGDTAAAAQLMVRPFFSGCGPRSYRNVGFHLDSEENGERFTWLPNVRGPRLFADTNGRYHDEAGRCLPGGPDARTDSSSREFDRPAEHQSQNSAVADRVISSQTYFGSSANGAKRSQALRFSLRSNQKINRALRAAYRKFDRTAETERLLRKHLSR